MAVVRNPATRSTPNDFNASGGYDCEAVTLATDYAPVDNNGNPVVCSGFMITGAGAVKILTAGGHTTTIPSGIAIGVIQWVAFSKIFSGGTTATGIVSFTT